MILEENLAVLKQSREQNGESGSGDHRHHRGAQGLQHSLQNFEIPVSGIKPCQQGDENAGGQNAAEGGSQGAWDACHLISHKGGGVDGNGARCHLGNGDQVCEIGKAHPMILFDHLLLDERKSCVAASEAEGSDL